MAHQRYKLIPKASHAIVEVATTTALKTLLQVQVPANKYITVYAWGISFDGSTAGQPLVVDLVEVDVTATLGTGTQNPEKVVPGIGDSVCNLSGTGWNASAEGAITASRHFDGVEVPPTSGLSPVDRPLGRDYIVGSTAIRYLRLRALGSTGVTPNAVPWVEWEEG